MALSVGVLPAQKISSVGVAPSTQSISGVGVARPTGNLIVGRDYGTQGYGPTGYSSTPLTINTGKGGGTNPATAQASRELDLLKAQVAQYQRQMDDMRRRTAPSIDYVGINNQARSLAESQVNPRYTLLLNQYLKGAAEKRNQRQAQAAIDTKNLEDTLAEELKTSDIKRTRTTEDTAQNLENLATSEDQYQTDEGNAFDKERIALASDVAARGLIGSGQGAQEMQTAQDEQFTKEGRQVQQFQQQKDEQNLFKTRTFEDLFRGDELNKAQTTKGKEAVKFDLDNYFKNQDIEDENFRITNENARLDAVAGESDRQSRALTMAWVESIKDPLTRQAAREAYL